MFKFLIAIVVLVFAAFANAQTIKIVVPFPPGGGADKSARAIQRIITTKLPNYNVQLETILGAGGLIASRHVANYVGPDTVLYVQGPGIITASFADDAGYNLQKDFVPILNLGFSPMVLITNPKSGYTSIDKILASNKPMFYGTAGTGTGSAMAGETLKRQINKDLTAVPYKGDPATVNDILANNLSFTFVGMSAVQGLIDTNQIVTLGVTGTSRNSKIPTVPTMSEQGIKGFENSFNWMGLFASSSASTEVVANIKKAIIDSLKDPAESQIILQAGFETDLKNIMNIQDFIAGETVRYRRLLSAPK